MFVPGKPFQHSLTNTLAYTKTSKLRTKKVYNIAPTPRGPNVVKKFDLNLPIFVISSVFVPGKLFQPTLTNTLAQYDISKLWTKKFYNIGHCISYICQRFLCRSYNCLKRCRQLGLSKKFAAEYFSPTSAVGNVTVELFDVLAGDVLTSANFSRQQLKSGLETIKLLASLLTWGQCCKTLYGRKLRLFIIS